MTTKPNPTGLKLRYLREGPDLISELPAQPVLVKLKGNKTESKLVPVSPLTEYDKCIGCVAEENADIDPRTGCFTLPDCDKAIYVHANKTNLLRHMIWRLENDK